VAVRRLRIGRLDETGSLGFTSKWAMKPGKQVRFSCRSV
jgi:hypothetical protein